MKLYKIASLCVAGFFIVGCGNSMPSCDDKEVKDLLGKIVKDATKKIFGADINISFSGFATNEKDEVKKQVTCQAMAKVTHDGESEENMIHYAARLTDDGQIYVKWLTDKQ